MNTTFTLKPHGLVFDPHEHVYAHTETGELYTGVTTVLKALSKEWLAGWAVKVTAEGCASRISKADSMPSPDWIRQQCDEAKKDWRTTSADARDVGTEVHRWIEAKRKGLPLTPLTTDAAKKGTEALLAWERQHAVEILASEVIVCSHQERMAGTLDAVARVDGQTVVLDYKTSSGVFPEMALQTAAYLYMLTTLYDRETPEVTGRAIVRLDKKSGVFEYRLFDPSHYTSDVQTFLALREVHRWLLFQERLRKEGNGA